MKIRRNPRRKEGKDCQLFANNDKKLERYKTQTDEFKNFKMDCPATLYIIYKYTTIS